MSSLKIREAIGADRDAILRLVPRLRAFGTTAFHQAADLDEGERRTINQYFEGPPEGARLWVAEDEAASGIAGAAYAQRMIDYFTQGPHAHLGILMVAEQSEGCGVGRALMHRVEDWARKNRFKHTDTQRIHGKWPGTWFL
jgi:GNAT superfamily N-acetyltransferase